MDNATANPIFVALCFVLRCMVPLVVILGISYLLRRFGLIAQPPKPPKEYENENSSNNEGGLANDALS